MDGDVDIAQPPVGDRRAVLVAIAFDRGKARVSHLVPVVLAGHVAGDLVVPWAICLFIFNNVNFAAVLQGICDRNPPNRVLKQINIVDALHTAAARVHSAVVGMVVIVFTGGVFVFTGGFAFAFIAASLVGRCQRLPLVGEQAFAHLGFRGVVAVGTGNFLSLVVLLAGLGGLAGIAVGLGLVAGLGLAVGHTVGLAVGHTVGLAAVLVVLIGAGLVGVVIPLLPAVVQLNGDPVVPQAVLQLYLRVRDGVTRSLLVGLDDHRLPVDGVAVVNPVFLHQNL